MSPDHRTSGAEPAPEGSAAPDVRIASPPKVKHRPGWVVFVTLGAIVCLGMGVWQIDRFLQASGTAQNLGYSLMWPFLAWFLFYAYFKYIRLEADEASDLSPASSPSRDRAHPTQLRAHAAPSRRAHLATTRGSSRGRSSTVTEIPAEILPARRPVEDEQVRDAGLETYNAYLAELARQDGEIAESARPHGVAADQPQENRQK